MPDDGHHVPSAPCPGCGQILDGAAPANPELTARPRPGDLTICIHCSSMLAYTDDLGLREATAEEMSVILCDPHGIMVAEAIQELWDGQQR